MKLLHKWYFQSLINFQDKSEDQESLNLQHILGLNQLMATFENQLESLAENITNFWTTLLHEKDIHKIYDIGLGISDGLRHLNLTY